MDLSEYYGGLKDQEAALVMESGILEERGLVVQETGYIPLSVVNTYLNARFFWDEGENQILYATPSELTRTPAQPEAGAEVYIKDGTVYLSIPFVGRYTDMDAFTRKDPGVIAIWLPKAGRQKVTVQKGTAVRLKDGIKSPILGNVVIGDELYLLETQKDWMHVATKDGLTGYVQTKTVSTPFEENRERSFVKEEYSYYSQEAPVVLAWHNVDIAFPEGNAYLNDMTANTPGLNVISPTWMRLHEDNSGNIHSIASAAYVEEAHGKGIKVWGLLDNFGDCSTYEILSSTATRQNLIANLIREAVSCNMDGINIDLELLREETIPYLLEFLRELFIECHRNGLVLSIDTPVPDVYYSFYDLSAQGEAVDYMIIMGYDEHGYGDPPEPGSVASLPWVEEGVKEVTAQVPNERVILAMPFYTRDWKTLSGTVSISDISMNQQQELVTANHAEIYWDKVLCQHVATYEAEGASHKIWMEDAESIAEKTRLSRQYSLAGVGCWRLGQEEAGIWQVITDNLKE